MDRKKSNQPVNTPFSAPLLNSREAEEAVIGALLTNGSAINEVIDSLTPEMFDVEKHAIIYQAVCNIFGRGGKIDMITVLNEVTKMGKADEVEGAVGIAGLSMKMASSAHIEEHAAYVHQLWLSRRLAMCCMEIAGKASDASLDISDTIGEALKEMESISQGASYNTSTYSIGEAATKSIKLYEQRKALAQQGVRSGIDTGIKDLTVFTNGGWKGGQLIILAARPAMGKTAFALHLAKSAAQSGTPVLFFSLEMDAQALTTRVMFSECDVDRYRYSTGKLHPDEEQAISDASGAIYRLPITIDDTPAMSMQKIKAKARNMQIKGKCGMVIIDYLQLIDMRCANKSYNREQEVAQTSRAAKIMAKELNIPVVLISQLNRANESRGDKIPMLSDLRESGAIEQDADIVIFPHRPEYYPGSTPDDKGKGILRIAKQRDGATGDINFWYNESLTKIWGYHEMQIPKRQEVIIPQPIPPNTDFTQSKREQEEDIPF